MIPYVPLQFNYIPYPLWRRRLPGVIKPIVDPVFNYVYPVVEDHTPPDDPVNMADFMVRYRLLPELNLKTIHNALKSSMAEIEHAPDTAPQIAAEGPLSLPAQWDPMESIIINWPVLYPPLWELHAQMAEAIAPVADVMINIPAPMWGHAIWLYLTMRNKLGSHADRVRLINLPTDDIWVRDHGPLVGYDQSGDRVVLDAQYDHLPAFPQDRDDIMPMKWAAHLGLPARELPLHTEWGNLWTDGAGTLIMTEQIFVENPQFTRETLEIYLHQQFDFEKLIITPRLNMEETGHVDLLLKLASADTVLISSPVTPISSQQLRDTIALFMRETNAQDQPYRIFELPTPPPYFNWFVYPIRRSYTNSLTVNGRVLVPVYGISQDKKALEIYKEAMPDYEIIPIDCKIGANGGGAVHCMTKEIPVKR